jgi:adenine-specific DNA-methyltransferase
MNHRGPRLLLLDGTITCSNTLHRVWLPNLDITQRKLIALSLLTTFSQLSAEIEGRSYGGGVLKIEPSDARRLRLSIPDELSGASVDHLFDLADSLLKVGQYDRARDVADRLIFKAGSRYSNVISKLKYELQEKRNERHTHRVSREKRTCRN